MSDYTQITDFSAKDGLTTGDPEKLILGSDIDAELAAIVTAVQSKYDSNDIASEAQAEAGSLDTVLITPAQLQNVLQDNAGMAYDIKELSDPGVDTVLGWDDSAGAVIGFTLGDGLEFSGTTIRLEHLGIGDLEDAGADAILFWDDSAGATAWLTAGTGITISGTTITADNLGVGSLSDPGADRIIFWDDSGGAAAFLSAANGVEISGTDLQIADQAASSTVPVSLTTGALGFDLSSITEIPVTSLSQAADGILVSDAGVLKVVPLDESGIIVVNPADAAQTFAITDANTMQVLDGTTDREWTIPANATVAFEIGTVIILGTKNTANITVTAATGVTLMSVFNTAGTTATSDTVTAGGTAALIKVAADEWMLSGDIAD